MKQPKKSEYYYFDKCAPKKEKRLCYGDCVECFWIDSMRYDDYLKENNLEQKDYNDESSTPPNCLIMLKGRVYGPNGEVKQKSLKVKKRRLLDDDFPEGYMESDKDFVLNNCQLCVEMLEKLLENKGV